MLQNRFLPASAEEISALGWDRPDIIIVTGDAYVDHPSFGAALIGRYLSEKGFRVAIMAQPDFKSKNSFKSYPEPRLFFGVTAGNVDSMVSNYSSVKKKRRYDDYSPGGKAGMRPDRAALVYTKKLKEVFPNSKIVLGGIEASLRRLAHYDYWDDDVKASLAYDSGCDLLVYGMGELAILEAAKRLKKDIDADLSGIRGTVVVKEADFVEKIPKFIELPSFESVSSDKVEFAKAFETIRVNNMTSTGAGLYQRTGTKLVIQYPPQRELKTEELDDIYAMNFTKRWHPSYDKKGGVPGLEEVLFSITSHRGCVGGCAFCAIWAHQGKAIQKRSKDSITAEVRNLTYDSRFKGIVHDIGGPTANFYSLKCAKGKFCNERECLYPTPCRHLKTSQNEYVNVLERARTLPKVKKVFIRSGVRFDYAMMDDNGEFLPQLIKHHISGQLKVAPEHVSRKVLDYMRKPSHEVYQAFYDEYFVLNDRYSKNQYLVPYFISGHPGCTLKDAIELSKYINTLGYIPQQVQDFTPTPMTESTCMYYTKIDPRTMKAVHVPDEEEKAMQRALMQSKMKENHELARKALLISGNEKLIGKAPNCLVPDEKTSESKDGKTAAKGAQSGGRKPKSKYVSKEKRDAENNRKDGKKTGKVGSTRKSKSDFDSRGKSDKKEDRYSRGGGPSTRGTGKKRGRPKARVGGNK